MSIASDEDRAKYLFDMIQHTKGKGFRDPNPRLLRLLGVKDTKVRSDRSKAKQAAKQAFLAKARNNPYQNMTRRQMKAARS